MIGIGDHDARVRLGERFAAGKLRPFDFEPIDLQRAVARFFGLVFVNVLEWIHKRRSDFMAAGGNMKFVVTGRLLRVSIEIEGAQRHIVEL